MPAIERQVMCVTCKIPLNVAESPQSQRERAYIRGLIAEGKTEAQIKSELVAQYGSSVLALPSAKGFDLAAYLVPVAVVLALIGLSRCFCQAGGVTHATRPQPAPTRPSSVRATRHVWTRTSSVLIEKLRQRPDSSSTRSVWPLVRRPPPQRARPAARPQ